MDKTVVSQVTAHDVEVDKISVDSIADSPVSDSDLLELADVVKAIEQASGQEIKAINTGFDNLKSVIFGSFQRAKKTEKKRHQAQQANKSEENRRETPHKIQNEGSKKATAPSYASPISTAANPSADIRRETSVKLEEKRQPKEKAEREQRARSIEITEEHEAPRESVIKAVEPEELKPSKVAPQAVVNTSEPAKLISNESIANYRVDDNGRLRNEKGVFASKAEQKQYEKANAEGGLKEGSQSEPEKQTSLLKQVAFSVGRLALIGAGRGIGREGLADTNSNLKTATGVAAGGSYFLAAQEIALLLAEAKDSLKESGINSVGDAIKKVKESASGAMDKVKGAGGKVVAMAKAVQVKVTGNDIAAEAKKEPEKKESPFARLKGWFKARAEKQAKDKPPVSELKRTEAAKQQVTLPKDKKQAKSAPSWLKSGTNPLFRFFSKAFPKLGKGDLDSLNLQKQEAQAAEQRHQESIIALGDIEDAIKGIKLDGGGSGIFGEALDFLGDRKKRKRGARGRTSARGRASRMGGIDMPERPQRVGTATRGSAYGTAGRSIPSVASTAGTAVKGSMGGAALRAGGAVLSKLALPLTVAMAAYDGFSGYNDKEGQKETFKLKDDQEASVGQKAAMATGSILSLGGLTEMVGLSGSDISKGVYKAFGGTIEGEESPSITLATPITMLSDAVSSLTSFAGQFWGSDQDSTKTPIQNTDKNTDRDSDRVTSKAGMVTGVGVAASAAAAPVAGLDVTSESVSKYVEDIEQIESVNKINERTAANNDKKTNESVKPSVINNSDPEIVKLLKSIDRKLDDKGGNQTPFMYRYARNSGAPATHGGGVPSDFANENQRKQANNLG